MGQKRDSADANTDSELDAASQVSATAASRPGPTGGSWAIDSEGARLHGHFAPAPAPKAALLLVHGFGEHSGRYARQIEFLTGRGISVANYDLRGHGGSPGPRGRVDVSTHVRDNLAARRQLPPELAGLPLLLMGHSMGGLIAAISALQRPEQLAGLILSSPALVVGEGSPAALRAIGPLVGRALPFLPVDKIKAGDISRVPSYVADYESDPLVLHAGVPASAAGSMLAEGKKMTARCRELTMPILLCNGTDDAITSVRGARRFAVAAGAAHDPRPEITYREFEGGRHELFNDSCADEVYHVLGEWLEAHVDS